MLDAKSFVAELAAQTKVAIAKAVEPLQVKLEALRLQLDSLPTAEKGDTGDQGPPGKDASALDIAVAVDAALQLAIKELPAPLKGDQGEKGDQGDKGDDAAPMVDIVARAIAELRPFVDETVDALVNERVAKAVSAIPRAKDGEPGKDAAPVPTAFLISEEGELVSVYPDGEKQIIGKVRGQDGKRGASVMDGSVDDAGQLVLRLSDGRMVNVGIVLGKSGAPGKSGEPGRSAAEIIILPGIDETRSYPEGTCALHRGGTIRASRATEPIIDGNILSAGWAVMMEGIQEEIEKELAGGRIVERRTVYTSGKAIVRQRQTAAMIYRGVWKDVEEYDRGDVTTWGGSSWHCQRPTKSKPGMGGDDWQLMVKRGADPMPTKH